MLPLGILIAKKLDLFRETLYLSRQTLEISISRNKSIYDVCMHSIATDKATNKVP